MFIVMFLGLSFRLCKVSSGISLALGGFNDKISVLLMTVLTAIQHSLSHPFEEYIFEAVYQREFDKLKNAANKVQFTTVFIVSFLIICYNVA